MVDGIHGTNRVQTFETEAPGATDDSGAETPALMPSAQLDAMVASGDVGAMLAAMLLESSHNSKKLARASKEAAEQAEEAAEKAKIKAMKDQAESKFIGGLAAGVGGIASGGCTIASGVAASHALKLAQKPEVAAAQADAASKPWIGSGTTSNAVGQGVGAFFQREADNEGADVAHAEQVEKHAGREVEGARDQEKDARDLAEKAVQFYKEYVSAKNEAAKAVLFRV